MNYAVHKILKSSFKTSTHHTNYFRNKKVLIQIKKYSFNVPNIVCFLWSFYQSEKLSHLGAGHPVDTINNNK